MRRSAAKRPCKSRQGRFRRVATDIADAAVVAQIAQSIGLDGPALMEAAQTPPIKDELRRRVEEAVAFGVFGAPTIVVDGEVFWGNDRLPQIERWLASGPF
jgi:2-hydroxychromene-2-carboxylate isomerase